MRSTVYPGHPPDLATKAVMMEPQSQLTFAWWNLHNFAHYDPGRSVLARRPKQLGHYEAKRDLILAAFHELTANGIPDLIAVCEITREAARDLVARLPSGFDVATSPTSTYEDDFQVAIFYRSGLGLTPELPLIPTETEDVSRSTRPMLPVHLTLPGHVIRFVACHWTGLDEDSSSLARSRLADFLRRDTYEFLNPGAPKREAARHVVVFGDLNDEPMSELLRDSLNGRRDRKYCRIKHGTDKQVRRVRLYNLAWRYLGEQIPHRVGRPMIGGAAGTYYHKDKGWRTHDHVLVSSGLLGARAPLIDEENTQIVNNPIMQDSRGLPRPFAPGSTNGISDHLPIVGRLIIPGTSS
jgi:endonuclease/exonuclease/phosphatase family metal-dependent hydrolase